MKETVGKVKTFVKEHKKELLAGLGLVVVGSVVGYNGYKFKRRLTGDIKLEYKPIIDVLVDGQVRYNDKNWISTIISNNIYKPEELGKLGEEIIESCSNGQNPEFTHFIAIGPNK